MNEQAAELVVEIAKDFADFVTRSGDEWSRGFARFHHCGSSYGATSSYVDTSGRSWILGGKDDGGFYRRFKENGVRLRELLAIDDRRFLVFLLTVDSHFDYDIAFEYDNPDRWQITKLDGGAGVPAE